MDQLEQGLQTAGIRLRESKFDLKHSDPKKWRVYLWGVWRRNQAQPEVAPLYQSKLLLARQWLRRWVDERRELKLPVTFDNWYMQPPSAVFWTRNWHCPTWARWPTRMKSA